MFNTILFTPDSPTRVQNVVSVSRSQMDAASLRRNIVDGSGSVLTVY